MNDKFIVINPLISPISAMCLPEANLTLVPPDERHWIDTLIKPFPCSFKVHSSNFEVLILSGYQHNHTNFNLLGDDRIYVQQSHIGERETPINTRTLNGENRFYYVHQPMFKPTGKIITAANQMVMYCFDGVFHNASGDPALYIGYTRTAGGLGAQLIDPPIPEYYLNGKKYEKREYFDMMEHYHHVRPDYYPEYDRTKYYQFMAEILGSKEKMTY